MIAGIYGFFDAQTNECLYVGRSTDIEDRYRKHMGMLKNKTHPRKDFTDWWVGHGENLNSLKFEILEECKPEETPRQEILWFQKLQPRFYGHKPNKGGRWQLSEETRRKISDWAIKNRPAERVELKCQFELCANSFIRKKNGKAKFCSRMCVHECMSYLANKELYLADLRFLYHEKMMSLTDIAKMFNTNKQRVHALMIKKGISSTRTGHVSTDTVA